LPYFRPNFDDSDRGDRGGACAATGRADRWLGVLRLHPPHHRFRHVAYGGGSHAHATLMAETFDMIMKHMLRKENN